MARSVTQLTYHPAFDPYHQIFRTVRLLGQADTLSDARKLRIADFYLLFPEKISEIRLSRSLRSEASRLRACSRFPYDKLPNSRVLFARMEPTFQAAIQTMLHDRLLDTEAAQKDVIAIGEALPRDSELFTRALEANDSEGDLMKFLGALVAEFPYAGADGLKDRTGLEEYRYDVA